jgi:hypothetical protein
MTPLATASFTMAASALRAARSRFFAERQSFVAFSSALVVELLE